MDHEQVGRAGGNLLQDAVGVEQPGRALEGVVTVGGDEVDQAQAQQLEGRGLGATPHAAGEAVAGDLGQAAALDPGGEPLGDTL